MRIVIIGPTTLTRTCLEALIKNGKDEILSIYTLADELGIEKSRFALMDDITRNNNITLRKVGSINDTSVIKEIQDSKPDFIFELGWSEIISPEILKIPTMGCIGVHASLLPRNRGAASLNWAMINDETKTGVTLFYLAEKPDDGDIIAQKEFPIEYRDDIYTLHAKSDIASTELILENIGAIREGRTHRIKQDLSKATYTKRRRPEDGLINWNRTSIELYNWIRAQTHPFPGAFTFWNGRKMYIWLAEVLNQASERPGQIYRIADKEGIIIGTLDKMLLVKRAQFEDGIEMWADDLSEKYGIKEGDLLE